LSCDARTVARHLALGGVERRVGADALDFPDDVVISRTGACAAKIAAASAAEYVNVSVTFGAFCVAPRFVPQRFRT